MRFVTNGTRAPAPIGRFVGMILTALSLAVPAYCRAGEGPDSEKAPSNAKGLTFAQIRGIVEKNLKANPRYRDGDLIVRCDVEPIFNELIGLGFMPADTEELYDAFLPDMAPLIQQLRTDAGRKFMLEIRGIDGAYDRLERLSWLQGGPVALGQLINAEDGVDKLRMLTTSAGAAAIRKQVPDDQRAQNFDRPTGHVHTAAALLKHLERAHKKRGDAQ
jgi:hypothetical protein